MIVTREYLSKVIENNHIKGISIEMQCSIFRDFNRVSSVVSVFLQNLQDYNVFEIRIGPIFFSFCNCKTFKIESFFSGMKCTVRKGCLLLRFFLFLSEY